MLSLLLFSLPIQAQFQTLTTQSGPRQHLSQSVAQLYNFEFESAQTTLAQLEKQYPGHPIVGLLSAVTRYWQWFPACTDARLESTIRQQLVGVSNASANWLANEKTNSEALYAYVSAEALLARLDNLTSARLASVGHAKNVYGYIRQCADLQVQFADFRFIAGLYNYYREVYPQLHPVYKPLIWFMRSGNKDEGIQQLTLAAKQSLFSKAEAGSYLAHVLTVYEKKPVQALSTLQTLVDTYPNNLYIQAQLANLLLSSDRAADAQPHFQKLLNPNWPAYRPYGLLAKAHYDLLTGQLELARQGATTLLGGITKNESLLAYGHQLLAQLAQRKGQSAQARWQYKQVLKLTEYPLLRDEAQAYLNRR